MHLQKVIGHITIIFDFKPATRVELVEMQISSIIILLRGYRQPTLPNSDCPQKQLAGIPTALWRIRYRILRPPAGFL